MTVADLRIVADERWYEPEAGGCLYRTLALQGAGVAVLIHVAVYSSAAAAAMIPEEFAGEDSAVDPQWAVWLTVDEGVECADAHGFCASWDEGWERATAAIPDVLAAWAQHVESQFAAAMLTLPDGRGAALVPPDAPAINSEEP